MSTDQRKLIIRSDKTPVGEHERRFNAPIVNEVAIVMVVDGSDRRDIIIQKRGEGLERIAETHRSYDSLQFPIIFWQREDGYHFFLKQPNPDTGLTTNKKISAMEFYTFRIMIWTESSNHILFYRELFHQYIVDIYAKTESESFLYIMLNQQKLRVEEYIHLRDAITNDGNVTVMGRMDILPTTYIGCSRYMHEYAQDTMTYIRSYGLSNLFITFTFNTAWFEIKEELAYGQSPADSHDLIAQVFKQKFIKLIEIITKSDIFYGEVNC
ncbi:hypothetical protein AVEN_44406-1 [Araneus ventricosus]|uniref:Helitron helicase-like domain-containing protein n=1 Tax=Araneus ventricosus TaxID=182803 RepID=A0A4Y2GVF2_ARAVE|nr:hypothetical protein AVEN_267015-1 [Araneus ventricosus]GBM57125.1 hypothetical protein AVEN_44406-1 [Araneus ventricosus]